MKVSIRKLGIALLAMITIAGGLLAVTSAPAAAATRCSGSRLYHTPVNGVNWISDSEKITVTVGYVNYYWEGYYNCAEFALGNPAGNDYDNTEWISLALDGGNNSFFASDVGDYSSYAGPLRAVGTGGKTYNAEGCFWDTDYYKDYYGSYSWQYTTATRNAYYCASTPYR